jgi:hypothetical protein
MDSIRNLLDRREELAEILYSGFASGSKLSEAELIQ